MLVIAALGAAAAAAAGRTQVNVYRAFTRSGQPTVPTLRVHGRCLGGSDTINRRDAWRCQSQQFIYDPCFSSRRARGVVICPARGLFHGWAIRIKLSRKLPREGGNAGRPDRTRGLPWALVTASGWRCRLITGATTVVHGQRRNYTCKGTKNNLWGAPDRHRRSWTIFYASQGATHLRRRTQLTTVWF